jgi:hypothetical protein
MAEATSFAGPAAPRRRWLRFAALAAAGTGFLSLALGVSAIRHYHQNHYRFQDLRLGMTEQEVESVFGRGADCTARLGAARLLVFLDPAMDHQDGCASVGPNYATPAELPWIYSSVQVVLDRGGRASAFVHVGESAATARLAETSEGSLTGLSLANVE